jgi:hypothetical protein
MQIDLQSLYLLKKNESKTVGSFQSWAYIGIDRRKRLCFSYDYDFRYIPFQWNNVVIKSHDSWASVIVHHKNPYHYRDLNPGPLIYVLCGNEPATLSTINIFSPLRQSVVKKYQINITKCNISIIISLVAVELSWNTIIICLGRLILQVLLFIRHKGGIALMFVDSLLTTNKFAKKAENWNLLTYL